MRSKAGTLKRIGGRWLALRSSQCPPVSILLWLWLKPSHSSYLPAYEEGTNRVFRNVGIQNSDAWELPRRKHRTLNHITCFPQSRTIRFIPNYKTLRKHTSTSLRHCYSLYTTHVRAAMYNLPPITHTHTRTHAHTHTHTKCTRWRSWLRYCATSRNVASSIPDGVIGIFHYIILPAAVNLASNRNEYQEYSTGNKGG